MERIIIEHENGNRETMTADSYVILAQRPDRGVNVLRQFRDQDRILGTLYSALTMSAYMDREIRAIIREVQTAADRSGIAGFDAAACYATAVRVLRLDRALEKGLAKHA